MGQGEGDVSGRIERARQELARLRDELGVQLHLAGLEAQEAWRGLEPHLARAQGRLEEAGRSLARGLHDEPASLEAHLALMETRDRLRELQPSLQALRARVRQAREGARAAIPDPVKLQARLASMELEDALAQRRREAARSLREIESFGRGLADEIVSLIDGLRGEPRS